MLDRAGDVDSKNSSSLNDVAMVGSATPCAGGGGSFGHAEEGSSRAKFEKELWEGKCPEQAGSELLRSRDERTFLRPRTSNGLAERFGDANSSSGSKFGCTFSAPVSVKDSTLEVTEEDRTELPDE